MVVGSIVTHCFIPDWRCMSLSLPILLESYKFFFYFFREPDLCFIDFFPPSVVLMFSITMIAALYFLPSACFRFILLFFRLLRWELKSLIWDHSSFLMQAFSNINFPLYTILAISHRFWYVEFSFHSFLCILKFPLILLLWSLDYLEACCLIFRCLEIFLLFFFNWLPALFYYDQRIYFMWFKFFQICKGLFYDPG